MTSRGRLTHSWGWSLVGYLTTLGTILVSNMIAVAQILPDSTLGEESSTVTPNVLIRGIVSDRINGGAIRDTNLFHSFEQFIINEGRGAYFSNPTGIDNIFSRVTGDRPSNILGRLGVLGNANLFLINPNGILFGTNASLDVQGSFAGTTANAIQFGELGTFSATNTEAPSQLLTVNPSAFLFNQVRPANIVNRSTAPSQPGSSILGLRVGNRENLLLLGGNVSVDGGRLNAFGGRVELGAVGGTGKVGLNADGSLNFPSDVQRADVSFTNGARVNVSLDRGGDIAITARNINILGESSLLAGIASRFGSVDSKAGDITLNATETIQIDNLSSISNRVFRDTTGNAGNIRINTGSLSVTNGAQLSAITFGQGNAGNIIVNASDTVSFEGISPDGLFRSGAFGLVQPGATGRGGNIEMTTGSLLVKNRAWLNASTRGRGDAGSININARDIISFDDSSALSVIDEQAVGNGGNIYVNTGSLYLTNGSQLDTSVFRLGQGNAGNIIVNARDTVSLDGTSPDGVRASTLFSEVVKGAVGNGGNVEVTTGSLFATNGGRLEASTEGQGNAGNVIVKARDIVRFDGTSRDGRILSGALSNVVGNAVGTGGNVEITAGSLFVANGAQVDASTEGLGSAGNIIINARNEVSFKGVSADGKYSSAAFTRLEERAVGNGGNLEINTGTLSVTDGAQLQAQTLGQGNAGNVTINARESILIDGFRDRIVGRDKSGGLIINIFPSGIFSDVGKDANGNGGDIRITTGSLFLTNGARLDTSTSGKGNAGSAIVNVRDRVNLGGNGFRGLFSTGISSNVEKGATGNGGNIEITAGSFSLTSGGLMTTSTSGEGNAGDIIINARDNVSFADNASSSVRQGAKGQGGDIRITTGSLSTSDGAQLLTITSGQGDAGDIIINARDTVSFKGTDSDSLSSGGALSRVNEGGIGLGGDIRIATGSLSLTNGAQLDASTLAGQGDAGNIFINARDAVLVDGFGRNNGFPSAIFTDTGVTAKGRGGIIDINTSLFRVANGAVVNARTTNSERGGDIIINANTLESINGGQILTTTLNSGQAGNITLSVTNNITIFGSDPNIQERRNRFPNRIANEENGESGLFANTRLNSTGNGGKINLQTRLLSLSDRAQISARSLGSGTAGDVTITADESVTLTNSDITTSAQQASGGAISLTAKTMRLYGDSDIRTNVENGINNGGNITLTANSIIAFDDSDILAFARDGRGGNVFLNTPAFFGENYQPAPNRTNPDTLDGNDRVDINASGGISSGIISTPDTSSIQNNLSELSQTPIDTNALIANSCIARNSNKLEGSFTITGLGGLPNRPGDVSITTYSTGDVRSVIRDNASDLWQKGDPIIEPQGVYKLPSGQLVLSRECR